MIDSVGTGSDGGGDTALGSRGARERRDAGLWYDANYDEGLAAATLRAKDLAFDYNHARPSDEASRARILHELIGHLGEHVTIHSPFHVDYGDNVSIGNWTFINHGAYLMDGAAITIGCHCFIGPGFGAYTAQHPLDYGQRRLGLERALPITIGDDCWIGANVSVMPGVTIGAGCVIAAGSLVTKDVPAGHLAMGMPCRPVRRITGADRILSDGLR